MELIKKIQADIKAAMIARDANKLGVLRFLLAQIHNFEIEKKSKGGEGTISDDDVLGVIRREYKKRKEAIEMFKGGGRMDLADKEEKELSVFDEYIPKGPTEAEIEAAAEVVVGKGGDFGSIMKEVMAKFEGRADGKIVSEIVKRKLGK